MNATLGNLPALDAEAMEALRESIKKFGVLEPILINAETGVLLDGHNRKALADILGQECPERRITIPAGISDEEVAVSVNTARRHLTVQQRRAVTAHLVAQGKSTRAIAAVTGVSHVQASHDAAASSSVNHLTDEQPPAPIPLHSPKTYSAERRAEVVARVAAGETASDVARSLNIPRNTIYDWLKKQGQQADQAPPEPAAPRKRLRIKLDRALPEMCHMLDGMVSSLEYLDTDAADWGALDNWMASLNQYLRSLNRFVKELNRVASQRAEEDNEGGAPAMGADSGDAEQSSSPA
jgi:transposase-like protein